MKTTSVNTYRENREKLSADELKLVVGRWVAFSADGSQIVASAATLAELSGEVQAAGEDLRGVVLEHIDLDTNEINLGGAELT